MLSGRRFRVEFADEQAEFAERIGAACRAVWNTGLSSAGSTPARWVDQSPRTGMNWSTQEHTWLQEVPGIVCSRR